MIVTVRGTNSNHNKAAHTTALLAGISAIKYNRKVLILQMCQRVPIEDLLIGKKKAETEIRATGLMFDDTGIDALFRRIEGQGLAKEHFDACCTPILSSENMLDVATMSQKDNFETEILTKEEGFRVLIDRAKDVYDDIYIYANGRNEKVLAMLNKYTDYSIACVRQGLKEEINAPSDSLIYLVTGYNENSTFNIRYFKNLYKSKNVFKLPYNIEYTDAYNNGTLMAYIGKNEKISEEDISFPLINAANELINYYSEGTMTPDNSLPKFESFVNDAKGNAYKKYVEPDVQVVEKRKGFLSNDKKKIVIPGLSSETPDTDEEFIEDEEEFIEDEVIEDEVIEDDEEAEEYIEDELEPEDEIEDEDLELNGDDDAPDLEFDAEADVEYEADDDIEETSEETDDADETFYDEDFDDDAEILDFEDDDEAELIDEAFMDNEAEAEEIPEHNKEVEYIKEPEPVKEKASKDLQEWTCPKCGSKNNKKFCPECGTKQPLVLKEWYCPECGTKQARTAKFCCECGSPRPKPITM